MQTTGAVGQPGKIADGNTNVQFRQGSLGETIVSGLHGDFYEQSYRGNSFAVASQAAVTTTAGLATTWTGLAIYNPTGSGVNAVILRFCCAQFAVGAASAIGIMTGSGAATGTLVPRSRVVGAPTGKVLASAGATIATPVLEEVYGQVGSLATTGYGLTPGIVAPVKGSLIVPPGFYAASYTSVATTSSLLFSFLWEEVPV